MRTLLAVLAIMLACGSAAAQDEYTPADEPDTPAAAAAPAPAPGPQENVPAPTAPNTEAVLQGLDKVTARISTFDAPLDKTVRFGTLEITAHACFKTPPEEPPESAAFLEIWDAKPGEPKKEIFTGWMFASSPALDALEHPVYDVWVLNCKTEPSDSAGKSG